jgi:WD40 repeat protein
VVRLWDTERNQLLYAFTLPYDLVSSIAFSRDGQLLATGGTDGKIRLWEAATGALLEVLPDQPADVQAINFNADNQIIAFYQDSQAAYAWDAHTKETLIEVAFPEETTPVLHRVSFNAADDQIIAVGGDGTVRFWDVSTGEEQGVWSGSLHADEWSRLAMDFIGRNAVFSQDRTHLAILDQQTGELFLWRFDAGTDPVTMQTPVEYFGCNLAFSGDHRWLIFGGQRPGLWLWEFDRAMNLVHESLLVPNYISWLPDTDAFSPTEPLVSYLLNDPAQRVAGLYLHNIETGESRVVTKVEQITSALVFSSDGSLLALRQLESLRLWDVHTGTLETEFEVCRDVGSIVFSPDGSLISVMCRYDVELYDAWSGEKLNTLIGHTSQIESVAFNVDGTLIVTAGADGTVRLWGVE